MTAVRVDERPAMTLATMRVTTTPDRLGETIGRTVGAVSEIMGNRMAGRPAVVRYLGWSERVELEIGYEVDAPVDGLALTRVAGGPAAVAVHVGPYDGLAGVTDEVARWVEEHGRLVGVPYEVYLDQHDEVAPDRLRTQVVWPIEIV